MCEEASCPNIGDKCTRRCPFCDVGHGNPDPLDVNEPAKLETAPRLYKEVLQVMRDMRAHDIDMITVGQSWPRLL